MKINFEPEKDEPLREVLSQWTVDIPLPPRFQEQVWHRIAQADTQAQPSFWNGLRRWLESGVPRPQVAYSYVSILLILGVLAGSWAAQSKTSQLDAALSARYVQSVDPYRTVGPNP